MNTLKDFFDNIYHEHYNYWSLTSLVYFFNQFKVKFLDQKKLIHTEVQLEFILKKIKKLKLNKVKKCLKTRKFLGLKILKHIKNLEKKSIK